VWLDRVLGLGSNPTAILQHYLRYPWVDIVTIGTYVSFFIVPTLVALALWWRRLDFRDFVAASAIVHVISLIVHYALPTVPPWLASANGLIEPIQRIFVDGLQPSAPLIVEAGYRASSNDVAAMPSVHMAITVLAALASARFGSAARAAGYTYVAIMLFSITYLGEHYIVDGLAGVAIAVIAWRMAPPLAKFLFPEWARRESLAVSAVSAGSRLPDPAGQVAE
jgi:membrane-associated phospholipid phosphatase